MPEYIPYLMFFDVVCMGVAKNIFAQIGIGSRDRPEPWIFTGSVFALIVFLTLFLGFKVPAPYLGGLGGVLAPFMFRWRIRFDTPQSPPVKETPAEADFVQRRTNTK